MTRYALVLALALPGLAGCQRPESPAPAGTAPAAASDAPSPSPSTPPEVLTANEWRLVEIQSMDDAQGTTKPDDPSKYTMRLNPDGSVTMRLNCNRASGTWSAKPGPDGASGSFEFGPLAGTRALCPPPTLDERVTSQAQYVRSYLIRDGRLSLSLMADGGIYTWEPITPSTAATSGADPSAALPDSVVALIKKEYSSSDMPASRYLAGRFDLNGDGRPELIVHVVGPMPCGTGGCPTLVFTPEGSSQTLMSTISVSRPPIRVSPRSSHGWRNLIVEIGGGGGRGGHAEVAYDGKSYAGNPTVAPARRITDLTGAEIVIGEFPSFDAATPLPPG